MRSAPSSDASARWLAERGRFGVRGGAARARAGPHRRRGGLGPHRGRRAGAREHPQAGAIARTLAGHSLSEVVEYLEQRRDDLDAREGPSVLDRTDAVQLMTVHASKGLEFPIVFVPEAHLTARGSYAAVRWRRGDGVSATMARGDDDETRSKPGFYAHLQRQDDREEAAEHRRLFYVAATPAADYLYV